MPGGRALNGRGGGVVGEIPVQVLQRKSADDWQKVTEAEWELVARLGGVAEVPCVEIKVWR